MTKTEIFGQNRPQSSKQYSYIGKKTVNSTTENPSGDVEPGPQSYQIKYNVAENAPKGGNFGPTRDKFLESKKEKKPTNKNLDQPLLYPKYDYVKK